MSTPRKEKRRLAKTYCVEVERREGKARFVITGDTPTGRRSEFTIDAHFYQMTCLVRQFQKAWADERKSRMEEIGRIDASLPAQTI